MAVKVRKILLLFTEQTKGSKYLSLKTF